MFICVSFQFVKSTVMGLFDRHKETLGHLLAWVFFLDHIHYEWCVSIHLQDIARWRSNILETLWSRSEALHKYGVAHGGWHLIDIHQNLTPEAVSVAVCFGSLEPGYLISWSKLNNKATTVADILTVTETLPPEAARIAPCVHTHMLWWSA